MHIAESVAKEKDVLRKKCISNGWWRWFLGRKPLPCVRLLTSAESLAMLEEKEKIKGKKRRNERKSREKETERGREEKESRGMS